MRPDVLIVGQGLAGTLVAWELERAGIAFHLADAGRGDAATLAAAGIVNPVTGRRFVKSWRIDALLPRARATFHALEAELGVVLWRELRVRRLFVDERERAVVAAKRASGELAPFLGDVDDQGAWFAPAARVDLPCLLSSARARWAKAGKLRAEGVVPSDEAERHALVIDCRGHHVADEGSFAFVPWEFSKGDVLEIAVDGLADDVVLNRRHWILPMGEGRAWVGATQEPGVRDARPSAAGRATLEQSAREILSASAGAAAESVRPVAVVGQRAGVRLTLPDRRPVAGLHPTQRRLGLATALGGKGVLWAPLLAAAWAGHLRTGAPFDSEFAVDRFVR